MTPSTLPINLVASGDLRLSANQNCWEEQSKMEQSLIAVIESMGGKVRRVHDYDPVRKTRIHFQPTPGDGCIRND